MSVTGHALPALPALPVSLAEPRSQEVTDWGPRLAWAAGLLLAVALVYWLMRRGWTARARRQADLPEPPGPPSAAGTPRLRATGTYHGSTVAGRWLERIVAHGLGTRSRAEFTLRDDGLVVTRTGARSFFVPVDRLRGARLDTGIAGKVLTEGGLLVVTWALGDRLLDSGLRLDRAADHGAWVEALTELAPADAAGTAPAAPAAGGHLAPRGKDAS